MCRRTDSLDVGQDTSLGNGYSRQELVELLVVADGQLQGTGKKYGSSCCHGWVPIFHMTHLVCLRPSAPYDFVYI